MSRVAILIETSTSWGRRVIEGVGNYARVYGPWAFHLEAKGIDEPVSVPEGWEGEGIIARVPTAALAGQLKALDIPVVNVSGIVVPGADWPRVMYDEAVIDRLALDHLIAKGFRHFAYCGDASRAYVHSRAVSFRRVVEAAGFACHVYEGSLAAGPGGGGWARQQAERASWLSGLPKPVGVVAWSAVHARRLAEACRWAGIHVPEDVAIIGVGADDLMNEMVHPPLSSVELPFEKLGYEAASILHRMMRGEPISTGSTIIPPIGVVERQSTDVLAVDDADVRDALRFIRENANRPLTVPDIVAHLSISRRVLERRFRTQIGRTLLEEVRRVRLERAKQLLVHTVLAMPDVAKASGFGSAEAFIPVFRKYVGTTPLAYRKRFYAG